MAFFSSSTPQKKVESKPQAIPPEILSSVRVMGEEKKPAPAENLPVRTETTSGSAPSSAAPTSPSPFLSSVPKRSSAPAQITPPSPVSAPLETDKKVSPPSVPVSGETKTTPVLATLPAQKAPEKPTSRKKGMVFVVVGLCILLAVAGGGYYYWQSGQVESESPNPVETPVPGVPEAPSVPPQTGMPDTLSPLRTLPYALDMPNYLSIDTETAEVAGVRKNIDDVAKRLIDGNVTEPIEFIITDTNNNPIAFSRFAYLLGLSLPQELLAEIEEPFALYLASEGGRAVVGLELTLRDPAQGSALITEHESGLPLQLFPLLYSGTNLTVPASVTFTPSPSRADVRIVRYHNFSLNPNISFDYTVSGKQWFIGTSKEMFRLMLEKNE